MLPAKYCFIWPSGFRGADFQKIDQPETRISYGDHVCWQIGTKLAIFLEDLPWMLPTKCQFIWICGFREDFFKLTNQK